MKHIGFLLFLLSFCGLQAQSIYMRPIDVQLTPTYQKLFKKYEAYNIGTEELSNVLRQQSGNIYHLVLRAPDKVFDLELFEYQLTSPDYKVHIGGGRYLPKRTDFRWFRGNLTHDNSSVVCLTVSNNSFKLMIVQDKETYFLEQLDLQNQSPLYRSKDQYIWYKKSDVNPIEGVSCGAMEYDKGLQDEINRRIQLDKDIHSRDKRCLVIGYALASDFTMYGKYGRDAARVEDAMLAVIAQVQTVVDNEFEYEYFIEVGQTWISVDTIFDPFWRASSINEQMDLLIANAFIIWPTNDYDLGTLWTAKWTSGVIGLAAGLRTTCDVLKYNICSDFLPGHMNADAYLTLQAHEIGHNFGCIHDPPLLAQTIMAPVISFSRVWSPLSIAYWNDFVRFNNLPEVCLDQCPGSEAPEPEFEAIPEAGCTPLTVQFRDLSLYTTSWKWSFPGGVPSSSTARNPVVVYNNPGKFDVELQAANQRCKVSLNKPQYIDVNAVPRADFNFFMHLIDKTVDFGSLSQRAAEWFWKFGDGNTSTEENPSHLYDRDSIYTVELTVRNECGSHTIKKTINLFTIPEAEFTSDTIRGCAPTIIKFKDQSSNNVVRWTWEFPGGNPSISTEQNPVVRYENPGIYDAILTVNSRRYKDIETKKSYIRIDSLPDGDIDYTINGATVNFTSQSRYGKSQTWFFGDGATSTEKNPTHTYNDGRYNVVFVATNECGDDTTRTTVAIGAKPIAGFSAKQTMGCAPFEVEFENTSTPAATDFRWYFPGGVPSTSTERTPKVRFNDQGKYSVKLVAYNALYTDSIEITDYITVLDEPTGQFSHAITGLQAFFTNLSSGASSYFWDFGDNTFSTEASPTHEYNREGEFNVRLIVENLCGIDTIEKVIAVYLIPKVNFTADVLKICEGEFVSFKNLSSSDVTEWAWQFEGGSPSSSNEVNPIVKYNKKGKYSVKLTVRNSNGTNSLTKVQHIEVVSTIFCPEHTKTYPDGDLSLGPFKGEPSDSRSNNGLQPFVIFPNPATQMITVVIPDLKPSELAEITFFNISGKQVFQTTTQNVFTPIDLTALEGSAYLVKLKTANAHSLQKLVVIK